MAKQGSCPTQLLCAAFVRVASSQLQLQAPNQLQQTRSIKKLPRALRCKTLFICYCTCVCVCAARVFLQHFKLRVQWRTAPNLLAFILLAFLYACCCCCCCLTLHAAATAYMSVAVRWLPLHYINNNNKLRVNLIRIALIMRQRQPKQQQQQQKQQMTPWQRHY